MIIREATLADAAVCAAIYAPYVEDSVASFELAAPPADQMAERIAAAHGWVVAEDYGDVVGFANAGPHHSRAAYRWAASVGVYVAATHHRRGVAHQLYRDLFVLLRTQGFRWATAGITLPNPASVGLHESFGFAPVGVWRDIGHKFGGWHDVGWWQLELQSVADPPAEPG